MNIEYMCWEIGKKPSQKLIGDILLGMTRLSQREQIILMWKYGAEYYTNRDIALRMGVTKQRISQLHSRAMRKIRQFIRLYAQ